MPTDTKPLSDQSKEYIFNELKKLSDSQPTIFRQKLIQAACDNSRFPPIFKDKLSPLQQAYQAHQDDPDQKPLLEQLLQNYFDKQGISLFINDILKKPFVADDWSDDLTKTLAGSDITIPDDTLVEATIKDGKVYWCVHYGTYKITYRRENCSPDYSHKNIIEEARNQNRTFSLTWKKFRTFKDAGKRTGTVEVTEDRFANEFQGKPRAWSNNIHDQLIDIGILNCDTHKLSRGWYPLSQITIKLQNVTEYDYQKIATALKNITNNPAYQEEFSPGLTMYRPACASKNWAGTGLIQNDIKGNFDITRSKPWDVAVYSELHTYSTKDNGFEADHIPSKAQIKRAHANETLQAQNNLTTLLAYSTESAMQGYDVKANSKHWQKRLNFFKSKGEGPKGFWCIYVTKSQHDFNPTTRLSEKEQAKLTPYDSIKKYLDIFEEDLKQSKITLTQFIYITGAFRYLVSRMCKDIDNIENEESKNFIYNEPNYFFSTPAARKQLDDLFINKIQHCMGN